MNEGREKEREAREKKEAARTEQCERVCPPTDNVHNRTTAKCPHPPRRFCATDVVVAGEPVLLEPTLAELDGRRVLAPCKGDFHIVRCGPVVSAFAESKLTTCVIAPGEEIAGL